jgi:hypothetical protein
MEHDSRLVRVIGFVALGVCFATMLLLTAFLIDTRTFAQVVGSVPAQKFTTLDKKFEGSPSCSGTKCHDKAGDDAPPKEIGHESTIWTAKDHHAKAFKTLSADDSVAIAKKLNLNATESDRCLSCHALNVPANLRGGKFNIREGVSCDSCHGPSDAWLKPHAEEKNWAENQRKSADHDALLKKVGFYDTKPVRYRAELCASCHLASDADLVAAGHPQPMFELDYFQFLLPKHWLENRDPPGLHTWLSGQVVGLRDAMHQLADRAKAKKDADSIKQAYQQAMSHAMVLTPAASLVGLDAGALQSHVDALTKAASDPMAGAQALASEAAAAADMADKALPNLDHFDAAAHSADIAKILTSVASAKMREPLGQYGMSQQAWSISTLYNAYAAANKVADADKEATNTLIDPLLPNEKNQTDAGAYDANLEKAKAKLPK